MKLSSLTAAAIFALALLPIGAAASVTVGGLTYSIQSVSVQHTAGPEGMEQTASGEYIVVKLKVSNVGKESANISASDFKLKRGDSTYDADNGVDNMSLFLKQLNPGNSTTGTVVFDVPAHTAPGKYSLVVWGNGNNESRDIQL